MRVYLAGPMSGLPQWNFPAFDAAAKRWRGAGHVVFSPTDIDRALGLSPDSPAEAWKGLDRVAIQMDVAFICSADAIVLLPGWEHSSGSAVELALAQFLGLPVYDAETGSRIEPPRRPWSCSGVPTRVLKHSEVVLLCPTSR